MPLSSSACRRRARWGREDHPVHALPRRAVILAVPAVVAVPVPEHRLPGRAGTSMVAIPTWGEAVRDRDLADHGTRPCSCGWAGSSPSCDRQPDLADDLADRLANTDGIEEIVGLTGPGLRRDHAFIALAVIVGTFFVQEGHRRVRVQVRERIIRTSRMTTSRSTYLPLHVNMARVVPVIFTASMPSHPPRSASSSYATALDFTTIFRVRSSAYIVGESLLHHHLHLFSLRSHSVPVARRRPEEVLIFVAA